MEPGREPSSAGQSLPHHNGEPGPAPETGLHNASVSWEQCLEEPHETPWEAPCKASQSPTQHLGEPCTPSGRAPSIAWESPQQDLEEPCTTPQEAPCCISMSPVQHQGETSTPSGRAPSNAWESPQQDLEEPCTTSQETPCCISMTPVQHQGETCTAPGRAPSNAWESPQQDLEEPCITPQESQCSISMSPMQHLEETSAAPGKASRNTWQNFGLLSLLRDLCPKNLEVDCCGRSQRQVLPEPVTSRVKQTSSVRLSRVNGWSKPIQLYQVIPWAVLLILALAMYSIFIPMMPSEGKYITYGIASTILLCQVICYIGCISIDPAEEAVRKKFLYQQPLPSFDRSKQQHVINDLYCSLCEVSVSMKAKHCRVCNKCVADFDHHCIWLNNCIGSRNYWWFFSLVAFTVAWLLCEISIILYIFIQHQVDPCVLHMDPSCGDVDSENTWLLFLPFFHVKAKTLVVVIIGAFVLILDLILLPFIGQLFFFHVFLLSQRMSTYDFMTWGQKQQKSKASLRNTVGSFQTQVFPQ